MSWSFFWKHLIFTTKMAVNFLYFDFWFWVSPVFGQTCVSERKNRRYPLLFLLRSGRRPSSLNRRLRGKVTEHDKRTKQFVFFLQNPKSKPGSEVKLYQPPSNILIKEHAAGLKFMGHNLKWPSRSTDLRTTTKVWIEFTLGWQASMATESLPPSQRHRLIFVWVCMVNYTD